MTPQGHLARLLCQCPDASRRNGKAAVAAAAKRACELTRWQDVRAMH